jgi:hypothetical protein
MMLYISCLKIELLDYCLLIYSQDAQIDVPSSASIEGLRASVTDIVAEFRAVNQLKSDDKG